MSVSPDRAAALINTGLTVLPELIALFRSQHATDHPGTPAPTEAEIKEALRAAVDSSVLIDERWKTAHPSAADLGVHTGSTGE